MTVQAIPKKRYAGEDQEEDLIAYRPSKRQTVASPFSSPPCFLDILPTDCVERIAQYVAPSCYDSSAVHLAQVSPEIHQAVFESLPKKLILTADTCILDQIMWALKRNPRLQQLVVKDDAPPVSICLALDLAQVDNIMFPRNCSDYIKHNIFTTVREFHVHVCKSTRRQILAALKRMPLQRLTLTCDLKCSSKCMFNERNPDAPRSVARVLSQNCPMLTHLSLTCHCRGSRISIWTVSSDVSTLTDLSIDCIKSAPEAELFSLLSLKRVRLRSPDAYRVGLFLGSLTVQISSHALSLDYDAVTRLKLCPQLQKLDIFLEAGAEEALALVIEQLPCLMDLELRWEFERGMVMVVGKKAIRDIIKKAKALRSISFGNAGIAVNELKWIAAHMGRRLETFGIPIKCRLEDPLCRIDQLLEAIWRHNPCIKRVYCSQQFFHFGFASAPFGRKTSRSTIQQANGVQEKLRRLESRVTSVDLSSLMRWVQQTQLGALVQLCEESWQGALSIVQPRY